MVNFQICKFVVKNIDIKKKKKETWNNPFFVFKIHFIFQQFLNIDVFCSEMNTVEPLIGIIVKEPHYLAA